MLICFTFSSEQFECIARHANWVTHIADKHGFLSVEQVTLIESRLKHRGIRLPKKSTLARDHIKLDLLKMVFKRRRWTRADLLGEMLIATLIPDTSFQHTFDYLLVEEEVMHLPNDLLPTVARMNTQIEIENDLMPVNIIGKRTRWPQGGTKER